MRYFLQAVRTYNGQLPVHYTTGELANYELIQDLDILSASRSIAYRTTVPQGRADFFRVGKLTIKLNASLARWIPGTGWLQSDRDHLLTVTTDAGDCVWQGYAVQVKWTREAAAEWTFASFYDRLDDIQIAGDDDDNRVPVAAQEIMDEVRGQLPNVWPDVDASGWRDVYRPAQDESARDYVGSMLLAEGQTLVPGLDCTLEVLPSEPRRIFRDVLIMSGTGREIYIIDPAGADDEGTLIDAPGTPHSAAITSVNGRVFAIDVVARTVIQELDPNTLALIRSRDLPAAMKSGPRIMTPRDGGILCVAGTGDQEIWDLDPDGADGQGILLRTTNAFVNIYGYGTITLRFRCVLWDRGRLLGADRDDDVIVQIPLTGPYEPRIIRAFTNDITRIETLTSVLNPAQRGTPRGLVGQDRADGGLWEVSLPRLAVPPGELPDLGITETGWLDHPDGEQTTAAFGEAQALADAQEDCDREFAADRFGNTIRNIERDGAPWGPPRPVHYELSETRVHVVSLNDRGNGIFDITYICRYKLLLFRTDPAEGTRLRGLPFTPVEATLHRVFSDEPALTISTREAAVSISDLMRLEVLDAKRYMYNTIGYRPYGSDGDGEIYHGDLSPFRAPGSYISRFGRRELEMDLSHLSEDDALQAAREWQGRLIQSRRRLMLELPASPVRLLDKVRLELDHVNDVRIPLWGDFLVVALKVDLVRDSLELEIEEILLSVLTQVTAHAGVDVAGQTGATVNVGGADAVFNPVGATVTGWTWVGAAGGVISSPAAEMTDVVLGAAAGDYTLRKTVTNNDVSDVDDVTVTVTV